MANNISKFIAIVSLLFFDNSIFCQSLSLENSPFNTEIISSKTLSDLQFRTLLRTQKECKFFRIRIRLESRIGDKVGFDPNPLSLILNSTKQRVRPSSFEYPVIRLSDGVNRVLMEDDRKLLG